MKIKGWKGWLALLGLVFIAGFVGAAAAGGSDTKIKTKTVTSVVNHTDTITATPQACLDALDTAESVFSLAGDGFTTAGEAMGAMSEGTQAILNSDVAAIDAATAKVKVKTAEMTSQGHRVGVLRGEFDSEASDCRAS